MLVENRLGKIDIYEYAHQIVILGTNMCESQTYLKLDDTLFNKAFKDKSAALEHHAMVVDIIKSKKNWENFIVLPPLFVQSKNTVVFDMVDMVIISSANGPVVPVVQSKHIRTSAGIIEKIYTLTSKDYLTVQNWNQILCV